VYAVCLLCVVYRGPLSCVDKGFSFSLCNVVIGIEQFVSTGGFRVLRRGRPRIEWIVLDRTLFFFTGFLMLHLLSLKLRTLC
jgi:hypothetical protein